MIHIGRILCPIDFSEASRHALQHAAVMARWYGSELTGLHVFTPAVIPPVVLMTPEVVQAAVPTPDVLRHLQEQLDSWLAPLSAGGLRTHAVVNEGDPTRCILNHAASSGADLIVIGTHGHGGFDRLVLGSVTEKVLRKATCPVMTVPPPAVSPRALPFKRLLCAVDFSQPSTTAYRYALSIAKESNARLTIVHVLDWPRPEDLAEIDTELERFRAFRQDQAERRLNALVSDEDRVWCEPVTRIEHGRPWQSILALADKEQTDLIVMGVHGRNVVDLTLFGSTTNHVVRRAPCPVLTLRQ